MLGFGWGMSHVLAGHQSQLCRPEAAQLGALLMLGTAAVDGLCDEYPEQRDTLLALLSPDLLLALANTDARQNALTQARRAVSDPDIRYVLDLVSAFFTQFTDCALGEFWHSQACDLLIQAYDAERSTLKPSKPGSPDETVLRAHRSARVLPFQVISTIQCGLTHHQCDRTEQRGCARAAELIGEAVAVVDDLADLCADAQYGSANSLLASSPDTGISADLEAPSRAIVAVLASGACWQAATTIAQILTEFVGGLTRQPKSDHLNARHRTLAYLWGWGSLGCAALDLVTVPLLPGAPD